MATIITVDIVVVVVVVIIIIIITIIYHHTIKPSYHQNHPRHGHRQNYIYITRICNYAELLLRTCAFVMFAAGGVQ